MTHTLKDMLDAREHLILLATELEQRFAEANKPVELNGPIWKYERSVEMEFSLDGVRFCTLRSMPHTLRVYDLGHGTLTTLPWSEVTAQRVWEILIGGSE